ncbi:hypothetical protein SKAU_G00138870 [Synaphobranchus kaupii]|uniref:Integrase zinc-binding domain-containing protein n=1 Tax=Synaphobranchus kaupii TaxID=118154 RepID=A0A9Q1FSG8_SYNKA|nr:hypothetical protein SKAU_G00138870 [Synaphobranchus kaupii]
MKPVPQMVSPRIQRWAVLLRAYEYRIVYKPGKDHSNTDALSRLPVPELVDDDSLQGQVLMIDHMDDAPVNMSQVRKWTAKDATLSLVHSYVLYGWPEVRDPRLRPYYTRRLELSARDGCVLWGARTVIPPQGRSILLKMLHQSHPGMSHMKGLARSYLWCPWMDEDIEKEAATGLSPAEMLMSRRLRSAFDLLKPDLKIQQKQLTQKEQHDKTAKPRQFMPGEAVYARNYGIGPKWIPATVESPSGPVSYTVLLGNGQRMRRHVDQVRARHPDAWQCSDRLGHPPEQLDGRPVGAPVRLTANAEGEQQPPVEPQGPEVVTPEREDLPVPPPQEVRHSTRERHSPNYLKDYTTEIVFQ